MSAFFLTEEQEYSLNEILDRENKKICEEQLLSDDVPEELKEIIRKTVEAGSPTPAFDPQVGYYSISFTPCETGYRIYVHHHLSNISEPIDDPLQIKTELEDTELYSTEIVSDDEQLNIGPEMTIDQIHENFGEPPTEIKELVNR